MDPETDNWDDNDDDGLPDAAFTEDELAAGVQHILRTGDPNATSSGSRPAFSRHEPIDNEPRNAAYECDEDVGEAMMSPITAALRFSTFAEARAWAQANPGVVIVRASDGHGFGVKSDSRKRSVNPAQREIGSYLQRSAEIKALVPHLYDVLSNSASSSYRVVMRPFYRRTWQAELQRLNAGQLARLRVLLAVHLEDSRNELRFIYAEIRRFPSMKAGQYGEALSERIHEVMEGALIDIDARLTKGRDA
jgi:hypothetical protein